MAADIGGGAGDINQRIRISVTAEGGENAKLVADGLKGVNEQAQRLGAASGPTAAYAAQLQAMGKGMAEVEVAGRGLVSTAQLAAERFQLLTNAVNGEAGALDALASASGQAQAAMDAMGASRRKEAEAMQQILGLEFETVSMRAKSAAAMLKEGEAEAQLAATKQKTISAADLEIQQSKDFALALDILDKQFNATIPTQIFFLDLMNKTVTETSMAAEQQIALQAAFKKYEELTRNLTEAQIERINAEERIIQIEALEQMALRGNIDAATSLLAIRREIATVPPAPMMSGGGGGGGPVVPTAAAANLAAERNAAAELRAELAGLTAQIKLVTEQADMMASNWAKGVIVTRGQMKTLTLETAVLDKMVQDLDKHGVKMGADVATAYSEAGIAARSATEAFAASDLMSRRLDANMNLAAGRARGLRGILNAFGMEWLSIGLIFGLAFEMIMRGLATFDRWLENPKSTGAKWLDDWKHTLREWKDAMADAMTDVFEKMSHTASNSRNVFQTSTLDLVSRLGAQNMMTSLAANNYDINAAGSASGAKNMPSADHLTLIANKAMDAEKAMTGMAVNSVAAINKLQDGLIALGDRSDDAAQKIREGLFAEFEKAMAGMVQSANTATRGILRAIEQMNAAGLKISIGDMPTPDLLKSRTEAWLGLYAQMAIATDDKVTDYYVFKTKGMIQEMLNDAAHLNQKLPIFLQQQATALGLKSDVQEKAEKEAEERRKKSEQLMKQYAADLKKAISFEDAGTKLQDQIDQAFRKLKVPSENPLDKIWREAEAAYQPFLDKIEEGQKSINELIASGDVKNPAAIKRLRDAYDALGLKVSEVQDLISARANADTENWMKKQAEEAIDAFAKLSAQVDRTSQGWMDSIRNLPLNVREGAQSEMLNMIQSYLDEVRNILEEPVDKADMDAMLATVTTKYDHIAKVIKDAANFLIGAGINISQQIAIASQNFGATVGEVFADLAANGGKNFGAIAANSFQKGVSQGANIFTEVFTEAIARAFGGGVMPGQKKPGGGAYTDDEANAINQNARENADRITGVIGGAFGAFGKSLEIFANAKKGQEVSVLATTLSFAATGASIGSLFPGLGTLIGAVVGAIAGLIIALVANTKAKKTLPYAEFGISEGEAYVRPFKGAEAAFANLSAGQVADMQRQIQRQFEEMTNGYIRLLLKFPISVASALNISASELSFTPIVRTAGAVKNWLLAVGEGLSGVAWLGLLIHGRGAETRVGTNVGDVGDPRLGRSNALKTFQADFDNWVKNTLPKQIAESFRERTSVGFVAMGLTVEKFNSIWNSLQGMDPKEALTVLNNLQDALISFGKVSDYLSVIGPQFSDAFSRGANLQATGYAQGAGISDFEQMLINSQDELLREALAVESMIGPEQIEAAKALGASLEKLKDSLTQFLNSVIQMSKKLHDSIEEARFGLKMDALGAAGNKQGQSDLLAARLISDYNKIKAAVNPEEIDRYTQDAMETINKLYQMDPNKRRDWADKQLADLDKLQADNLKRLGDAAKDQFQTLVDAMQPAVDFFMSIPDAAETPINNLGAAAADAAEALSDLADGKFTKGGYHKFRDAQAEANKAAADARAAEAAKAKADKEKQPTSEQINAAVAAAAAAQAALQRSGGRGAPGYDEAAKAAIAAFQRVADTIAPPSLNTETPGAGGPLTNWNGGKNAASLVNGKWVGPEGSSPDMLAYYIENALGMIGTGRLSGGATGTNLNANQKNADRMANLVDETQTHTRLLQRIVVAVENGRDLGTLDINVNTTTVTRPTASGVVQRSQVSRTISRAGAR